MERVVALNAPEPTGIVRLMANAAIKSCNLWEAAVTGPHRKGVSRVIATNAIQMTAYPVAHGRQIAAVSRFSAQEQLELMEKAGLPTARVDTDRDEFFGPYSIQPWDGRRVVLPGCHDQVIIDPVGFIADMPEQVLAR
jgi:hypothetical protein